MNGTNANLLALTDFNLVADHGGVGRASRASGRPKATLSRRVMELEESLGFRLFERGKRDLKLTEEGRSLHERSAALLQELDHVTEDLRSGARHLRGRLRVSAPALFSSMAVGRLAAGFLASYPDVRLEIAVEDRSVDLIEEGYDVAIRINPRREETLVGKCFLRDGLLLVAAPGYQKPRGKASRTVRAVVLDRAARTFSWTVIDRGGAVTYTPEIVLSLGTLPIVRDVVVAGAGAAVLPHSLVANDLANGRLVSWGRTQSEGTEIWVVYSSRRLMSKKVAAFVSYLSEVFPKGSPEELAAMRT